MNQTKCNCGRYQGCDICGKYRERSPMHETLKRLRQTAPANRLIRLEISKAIEDIEAGRTSQAETRLQEARHQLASETGPYATDVARLSLSIYALKTKKASATGAPAVRR